MSTDKRQAAEQTLQQLKQGNQRFVDRLNQANTPTKPLELVDRQDPSAIVIGCADARVPVEQVFDQGINDLFVVRVAGNVAGNEQIASVEYAALNLNTPLLVVLGHAQCGAVTACVDAQINPDAKLTNALRGLIAHIKPGVSRAADALPVAKTGLDRLSADDKDALIDQAIIANAQHTIERLTQESPVLGELVADDKLTMVAAQYDIKTGKVHFF